MTYDGSHVDDADRWVAVSADNTMGRSSASIPSHSRYTTQCKKNTSAIGRDCGPRALRVSHILAAVPNSWSKWGDIGEMLAEASELLRFSVSSIDMVHDPDTVRSNSIPC